jgi:hypothetical protein
MLARWRRRAREATAALRPEPAGAPADKWDERLDEELADED